ncbi:hypothetical protein [Gimesia sp.]|uniref:hypothetical protein n=1 Tax=Gimesia sp. TaxID=2024833 RepID=UPI0032ED359D
MPQNAQEVSVAELGKLSFLKSVPQDGRIIAATSFYENNTPYCGIPNPQTGEIIVMPNTIACWGAYWSTSQIDSDQDTLLPLLDTLAQHFTFGKVVHPMRGIEFDIGNLTAVIEKFLAVHDYHVARPKADTAVRLMYLTELEYFFGICRSLIDLLHDCYRYVHMQFGGSPLPQTFGKFVDREVSELVQKYSLPPDTETYLTQVKPLFAHIRNVRDSIYHHGKSLELIYLTEEGPGVCLDHPPFDVFKPHFDEDSHFLTMMTPNNIGSIFYIVVSLVDQMVDATTKLAETMKKVFSPIPPRYTKDGYNYFLRGPSFVLINNRHELLEKCWLSPARQHIAPHLDSRRPFLGPKSSVSTDAGMSKSSPVIAKNSDDSEEDTPD